MAEAHRDKATTLIERGELKPKPAGLREVERTRADDRRDAASDA